MASVIWRPPLLDVLPIGIRLLQLVVDQVRRALPHAVEPVDEDPHLGATRRILREEGMLRVALLEVLDDDHRVPHDGSVVVDDRYQVLPRDAADERTVLVVDPDRLDGELLVRERQRDPARRSWST
jgi:hypothetical protein